MQQPTSPPVRASDIVAWEFCAVKLYFERVERRRPPDPGPRDASRERGTLSHAAHDSDVATGERFSRMAKILSAAGVIALALMLVMGLASCAPADLAETQAWIGAFGAGFLVLGIVLRKAAGEVQRRTRVPAHVRMLSTDSGLRPGQLLSDDSLGLVGRPDYVFSRRSGLRTRIFTAELKSRPAPRRPFHGHVLQAAASIHLARTHYGRRASSSGLLVYTDSSVDIELTPALLRELEQAVVATRAVLASPSPPPRNHASRARCVACPFSTLCPASLAHPTSG